MLKNLSLYVAFAAGLAVLTGSAQAQGKSSRGHSSDGQQQIEKIERARRNVADQRLDKSDRARREAQPAVVKELSVHAVRTSKVQR